MWTKDQKDGRMHWKCGLADCDGLDGYDLHVSPDGALRITCCDCEVTTDLVLPAPPPESSGTDLDLLREAREAILRLDCGHALVCSDPGCRAAGHEHESYGEDGWSCGEECPCSPACEGHEPETCEKATAARELVARIDERLRAGAGRKP